MFKLLINDQVCLKSPSLMVIIKHIFNNVSTDDIIEIYQQKRIRWILLDGGKLGVKEHV